MLLIGWPLEPELKHSFLPNCLSFHTVIGVAFFDIRRLGRLLSLIITFY